MPTNKKELVSILENKEKEERVAIRPRIVVLGPTGVGKTSIVQQFFYQSFPLDHIPTVEEMYNIAYIDSGSSVSLDVLDTSGFYEFPAMRRLAIRTADAFVLVYAINDSASFQQVSGLRDLILEVREHQDSVPIVVVGNKCDLADNRMVSRTVTESVVVMDWEHKFLEASAKLNINVLQIFQEVLSQAHICQALATAMERRRKSCPVQPTSPKLKRALTQKRHSCVIQ